ncbi:MAG: MBL fold metallo-hydrolase [Nitrospirales bacterium]|nr:MBL fold metallo-hydrolase [Nitrospirales bacterium]
MPSSVIPIRLGIVKVFIVKGKRTVIVDTGYPGKEEAIIRSLQASSVRPEDVSLILITHGHTDHYGSAEKLRLKTGAPVAMHRKDAELTEKGVIPIGVSTGLPGHLVKTLFVPANEASAPAFKADILIDNTTDLHDFGVEGKVVHTPGHTEGSLSLILADGTAIVGDLLMGGLFFKKKPHYPLFATDIAELRESIRTIVGLAPRVIYASHGGPFSCYAVQHFLKKETNL